jgi:hypothetical protein
LNTLKIFLNGFNYTPIDFYEKKTFSKSADKFYFFSAALEKSYSNFEKYLGAGRMDLVEPGNLQESKRTAKKLSRYLSI